MNNVSSGMKSLCEDIKTGHEDRKNSIRQLNEQAEAIRNNARKFLADSKKFQENMSKELKKGLRENRENLIKNVNALRENFRKKEEEVKADLTEAGKIWSKMKGTLKAKN